MDWLHALDVAVFRWINSGLSHPWLDVVMPWFSGNHFFGPLLVVAIVGLLWKGGLRGRVAVFMIFLVVIVINNSLCDWTKTAVGRVRPFDALEGVNLGAGKGSSLSFPSAHAANWFAAVVVVAAYYRRTWRVMLPAALLVSFSRVYGGAHYPSDVLGAGLFGAGVAAASLWLIERLWRRVGEKWFPLWWRHLPSLTNPDGARADWQVAAQVQDPERVRGQQWVRLGYVLLGIVFVARIVYLALDKIDLSEDEAYQWLWSKHLALSYYSKPPLIAYTQFLGTSLWGDNTFGVRFFSPVIATVLGWLLLRFFAREVNPVVGFCLLPTVMAAPLMGVGAVLMTVDPLSVLFWTAAMLAGWRAVQANGRTQDWLWTGLWLGLGFLSKYTALPQLACFAIFFALYAPARKQLRQPGPYLALLVLALCTLPVLAWNAQHDWITVKHLGERAGMDKEWRPTLRFFVDFTGAEFGLLNPVFFVGMIWAAAGFWRHRRHDTLLLYLFCMGGPVFLFYWLYSLKTRVHPNWVAVSVLPLFCVMMVYGWHRFQAGMTGVRRWWLVGVLVGFPLVVLVHDTNVTSKIFRVTLPAQFDPLRRARGYREMAQVVDDAWRDLAKEGKPAFIIGDHYGTTGLLSFYLPEARARVKSEPLVFCRSSERPQNQFYFWPGYRDRKGQNALFVQQCSAPKAPPSEILKEFASVTDLGMRDVLYRGRVFHRVQLFACRDQR